jgi:hypothetical protein
MPSTGPRYLRPDASTVGVNPRAGLLSRTGVLRRGGTQSIRTQPQPRQLGGVSVNLFIPTPQKRP